MALSVSEAYGPREHPPPTLAVSEHTALRSSDFPLPHPCQPASLSLRTGAGAKAEQRSPGLLALFSFVLCDSLNSRRQLCRRCDGDFFEVGARVRDGV